MGTPLPRAKPLLSGLQLQGGGRQCESHLWRGLGLKVGRHQERKGTCRHRDACPVLSLVAA